MNVRNLQLNSILCVVGWSQARTVAKCVLQCQTLMTTFSDLEQFLIRLSSQVIFWKQSHFRHSYYGTLVGNHISGSQRYLTQWPTVTFNPHFKSTQRRRITGQRSSVLQSRIQQWEGAPYCWSAPFVVFLSLTVTLAVNTLMTEVGLIILWLHYVWWNGY